VIPLKLRDVSALAFEGGGYLGNAYWPIAAELERHGIRCSAFAGTSAGAITAMLLATRYSAAAIDRIQRETPWHRFASYRPFVLARLLARGGIHSMAYAERWISERLGDAGIRDATFAEVLSTRGAALHVVATRYERLGGDLAAEPFVFSPVTTPDVLVADAVAASMAVPLYWPPKEIDGWWFCDGGVAANHPLAVFRESHRPEQVLGIRVDASGEIERAAGRLLAEPYRPAVTQVVTANAMMLRDLANRAYVPSELWERTIRIDVGAESALDFTGGAERINRLRACGQNALEAWLQ
jgi:predicted acylesterase/phospholipase RssA